MTWAQYNISNFPTMSNNALLAFVIKGCICIMSLVALNTRIHSSTFKTLDDVLPICWKFWDRFSSSSLNSGREDAQSKSPLSLIVTATDNGAMKLLLV